MGSGISSTIGNVAEDAKFTITCDCCNEHAYRRYHIPKNNIKKLHLTKQGSSYFVFNDKMFKFESIDALHKFLHDLADDEFPNNCSGGVYKHKPQ